MFFNKGEGKERFRVNSIRLPDVEVFERAAKQTGSRVESYVAPVRETILKRYPALFTLLVTFGVVATFLGLEQILLKIEFLSEYPWLILLLGVGILIFTGHLYKKLG